MEVFFYFALIFALGYLQGRAVTRRAIRQRFQQYAGPGNLDDHMRRSLNYPRAMEIMIDCMLELPEICGPDARLRIAIRSTEAMRFAKRALDADPRPFVGDK